MVIISRKKRLQLTILYHLLSNWNSNKNLKKKTKQQATNQQTTKWQTGTTIHAFCLQCLCSFFSPVETSGSGFFEYLGSTWLHFTGASPVTTCPSKPRQSFHKMHTNEVSIKEGSAYDCSRKTSRYKVKWAI